MLNIRNINKNSMLTKFLNIIVRLIFKIRIFLKIFNKKHNLDQKYTPNFKFYPNNY